MPNDGYEISTGKLTPFTVVTSSDGYEIGKITLTSNKDSKINILCSIQNVNDISDGYSYNIDIFANMNDGYITDGYARLIDTPISYNPVGNETEMLVDISISNDEIVFTTNQIGIKEYRTSLYPSIQIVDTIHSWTPVDFGTDMFFGYDSANAVSSGGFVTSIPDDGPLGITATQGTLAEQPAFTASDINFNGEPSIRFYGSVFSGVRDLLIPGVHSSGSANWFMWAVLLNADPSHANTCLIEDVATPTRCNIYLTSAGTPSQSAIYPRAPFAVGSAGDSTARLLVWASGSTVDPLNCHMYVDGILFDTVSGLSNAFSVGATSRYGAASSNINRLFDCSIGYFGGVKRLLDPAVDIPNLLDWSQKRFGTP